MAVPYDTSLLADSDSLYAITLALNTMSHGVLGVVLWILPVALWYVVGLGTPEQRDRILATSFFSLCIAIILLGLELVNKGIVGISVAFLFAALAYHRWN